jgi:hypothetical protein
MNPRQSSDMHLHAGPSGTILSGGGWHGQSRQKQQNNHVRDAHQSLSIVIGDRQFFAFVDGANGLECEHRETLLVVRMINDAIGIA